MPKPDFGLLGSSFVILFQVPLKFQALNNSLNLNDRAIKELKVMPRE